MTDSNRQTQFHEIVQYFRDAMLVTHTQKGHLRARPMVIADCPSAGQLWFATDERSGKVEEIERDPSVLVTMQGGGRFLSMTGHATVENDRSKIADLWSERWRTWFPEGNTSRYLTLIHVEGIEGEFWDDSGFRKTTYRFQAGRAYPLQGDTETLTAAHGRVSL